MVREAEARYPNEGCGLVFAGADGRLRVQAMENVLDRYHARRPDRFPRTSARGYLIDPLAQLGALEQAAARGETLRAIFHSHVEVGAYFSEEDRAMAFGPDGSPLLSQVEYLVLSVRAGRCDAARAYALGTDSSVREQTLFPVA
jgi:[CysO sulfur-carrier protein]-S-L-cysteine hydrolase